MSAKTQYYELDERMKRETGMAFLAVHPNGDTEYVDEIPNGVKVERPEVGGHA